MPAPAAASPAVALPAAAPGRRARLDGLTGLRFFAAAWVFAYHFFVLTVDGAPAWVKAAQQSGHAAVSLFFVLSGFVLAYGYAEPLADGRVGRARFWWLRLARVWPLYALTTLVEIPLGLHAGTAPRLVAGATAADLVGLQAWIPAVTFVGNTPGWSVSVELFFYFVFPWLAARVIGRRLGPTLALVGAAALAAAAAPALVAAGSGAATFAKCGPLFRLPEFVVGVALGGAFVRRRRRLEPGAATALLAAALVLLAAIVLVEARLPRYFLHALLLAPFALVIWAVAEGGAAARALGCAPLKLLGEASYGLYLLQMPLFQAIGGKYEWSAARLGGYFVLLVAASIAVHFAVERPAQRWLRHRGPR